MQGFGVKIVWKILDLLRRVFEKPPRIVLWKAWHDLLVQFRRGGYWDNQWARLDAELSSLSFTSLCAELSKAVHLISPESVGAKAKYLSDKHPETAKRIIGEADRILRGEFALLGSIVSCEGKSVPWCFDWRKGHQWPRQYHADIDYSAPNTPTDVKYPWELSRFYFGLTLGKAYRLTGNVRYRSHWLALLRDWHQSNPAGYSVNWTSPLEVAIRANHISVALAFFDELSESDMRFVLLLLGIHGHFIYSNLEYTDIRGNHFTGNLYGLLVLGLLLQGVFREARDWVGYAERTLREEIFLQFTEDGVNIEKSIHYHRFVAEMYLLCAILRKRAGFEVSQAELARLQKAMEFIAAYLRPDGMAPVVGDMDDGFVLKLTDRPARDHRGTLSMAAAWMNNFALLPPEGGFSEEVLWVLGKDKFLTDNRLPAVEFSLDFREGGYFISRRKGHYLLVDVGEVGMHGRGGHGHNDALSFELCLAGVPLVVDPGMPTYTGDVVRRNLFRSTAYHNVAVVDGQEQAVMKPELLWRIGNEAVVYNVGINRGDTRDVVRASHAGYERLTNPVKYTRELLLDKVRGQFHGRDYFVGAGERKIELFFHLAPDLEVELTDEGASLTFESLKWNFRIHGGEKELLDQEISPGYGVTRRARTLRVEFRVPLPFEVPYSLTPE